MSVTWRPWSERVGKTKPTIPSAKVESYMRPVLENWISSRLLALRNTSPDAESRIALLGTRLKWDGIRGADDFYRRAQDSTESYFDAIEILLHVEPPIGTWEYGRGWPSGASVGDLEFALEMSGSAWAVGPDGNSLIRRVDDTAIGQIEEAAKKNDAAREDLVEAWNTAFGRQPNASDAWDHAIKAVEHVYSPLVLARQAANDKSTLGQVIKQLRDNRAGWTALIATDSKDPSSGVDVIAAMMRSVWGNPDRHGGGASWRKPELAEAQAIVQVAVTLVQWGRQGVLRKVER